MDCVAHDAAFAVAVLDAKALAHDGWRCSSGGGARRQHHPVLRIEARIKAADEANARVVKPPVESSRYPSR